VPFFLRFAKTWSLLRRAPAPDRGVPLSTRVFLFSAYGSRSSRIGVQPMLRETLTSFDFGLFFFFSIKSSRNILSVALSLPLPPSSHGHLRPRDAGEDSVLMYSPARSSDFVRPLFVSLFSAFVTDGGRSRSERGHVPFRLLVVAELSRSFESRFSSFLLPSSSYPFSGLSWWLNFSPPHSRFVDVLPFGVFDGLVVPDFVCVTPPRWRLLFSPFFSGPYLRWPVAGMAMISAPFLFPLHFFSFPLCV